MLITQYNLGNVSTILRKPGPPIQSSAFYHGALIILKGVGWMIHTPGKGIIQSIVKENVAVVLCSVLG